MNADNISASNGKWDFHYISLQNSTEQNLDDFQACRMQSVFYHDYIMTAAESTPERSIRTKSQREVNRRERASGFRWYALQTILSDTAAIENLQVRNVVARIGPD